MSGTFLGINTASSGLMAQQAAMDIIGQNITNSGNPAYRREQAVMGATGINSTTGAMTAGNVTWIGSGTQVTTIRRMQNQFVDGQLMASNQNVANWQASKDALDQVVGVIGEPSTTGLNNDLDKFWSAWQNLSLHPDDVTARTSVAAAGQAVAGSMNRIATQIAGVQTAQDQTIKDDVDKVNGLASQLADVNSQIQQSTTGGTPPNDLLDKRDDLLSQLSGLADVQVHGDGGANDTVTIGGHTLVQGTQVTQLATGTDASGHATVQWKEDGSDANITSGELGGVINTQKNVIPAYLASLDQVAQGLMTRVNQLHASGTGANGATGLAFFTGTGAKDMAVAANIVADPNNIAAGTTGAPGDSSIALAIAKVQNEALVNGSTIGAAFGNIVTRSAADAANASNQVDVHTAVNAQLTNQQQSVSGVSLDEEMADMVKFQQAYNASARVLSTMNDMLGTLMTTIGS